MRTVLCIALVALSLGACSKRNEPSRERHETSACVPVLPGWKTAKSKPSEFFISNSVTLAGNRILWNGVPVDEQTFVGYVRQLAPKWPVPFLIFDQGSTPDCSFARHVRDIVDQNYPCREGACGQGPTTDFITAVYQQPSKSEH